MMPGASLDPALARLPWLVRWPCGHWSRYAPTYSDKEQPGDVARRVFGQGCPCTKERPCSPA